MRVVPSICNYNILLLDRHLVQATLVAATLELGIEPDVEHLESLVVRDEACWHAQYVRVVVLT